MYIHVRVRAGAKEESFKEVGPSRFAAVVRQPAKQNLANRRVCELAAAHFKIPAKAVRIINGHQSPSKLLSLPD